MDLVYSASLIDKLIDSDPLSESDKDFPYSNQTIISNILRDLESLLNSRIAWHEINVSETELGRSIVNYGLPDFSSMPYSSQEGRHRLCEVVRRTILDFEPRLKMPEVSFVESDTHTERTLRLQISALCMVNDTEHDIEFESEVEPVNLGMKISRKK